ncbi:MAG: hypothetical protein C4524_09765 [Candidatus Zixiibacteriota bacterium]|nr:MAG: hypothetical protein C4524_09765 [candidate division Zixibacteria bacterium]
MPAFDLNQDVFNGRYRRLRLLGQGGMGAVFLVEDLFEEGRPYALKLLSTGAQTEVEAFRREFALLAELNHPNIARVYSFGFLPENGAYFYTTDFISGQDFYQAVRDRGWEMLVDLTVQVCRALAYLHGRGILHRDLKPDNILVDSDALGRPRARLCDFGLALRGEAGEGGFTGSLDYAAPELLKGGAADPRADLYALGVTLYQCVAGRLPFPPENLAATLKQRLEVRPARPSRFNPEIPPGLEEVTLGLLDPCPAERPEGARQVVERLEQGLQVTLPFDTADTLRAAVYSGRYIERVGELKELRQLAAAFLAGSRGFTVLIKGAFGCGKTRLLEEWSTFCQLEGLPFLLARGHGGEAFSLIKSWLRQLLGEPSRARKDEVRAGILEKFSDTLSLLLPAYYDLGVAPPAADLPEASRRIKIYEDLYNAFCELLEVRPSVLAADDLQQSDPATLEALRYILQTPRKPRAVWALALWESDAGWSHPETGGQGTASLAAWRLPADRELLLTGFNGDLVREYLQCLFAGQCPEPAFIDRLIRDSGGIPLFVGETLRELMTRNRIRFHLGAWTFPGDLEDAETIAARSFAEFLEQRLETVTGEPRQLLRLLALVESHLPAALVAAHSGQPLEQVEALLQNLERAGLVFLEENGGSRLARLGHRTIAERLRDEIPEPRRREFHRQLARELQQVGLEAEWVGEIARQWFAAREPALAADWGARAARQARQSFQNDSALEFYALSLQALEETGATPDARAEVRLGISELEYMTGRIPEAIQAVKEFLEAGREALSAPLRRKLCEALAAAWERKGDYPEALACWNEALTLEPDETQRALMMGSIGRIHYLKGDVETALALCGESLQILEGGQDVYGQSFIHNILGRIHFFSGDLKAAGHDWNRCLQLREQLRDKKGLADSHNNLGVVHSARGEREAARRHFEMALKLSGEVGDLVRKNGLLNNLGIMAYEAGDLDLAQRRYGEALEFLRRSGSDSEVSECLNNIGEISLLRGEYGAARKYWEECLRLCAESGFVPGTVEPLIYLATLHIVCNDHAAGLHYLDLAGRAAEDTRALKEQALIAEQRGLIALRERQFEAARDYLEGAHEALAEMKLTFLEARLSLRLAELAWYAGDRNGYEALLEAVPEQDSRWFEAEVHRLRGFDLRSERSEAALDRAVEQGRPFPDLMWRAYWLRGRFYHHRRRYGPAGENYQKAIETLKFILARLPEDLKSSYAAHPDIALLKDNAAKLKTEILMARSKNHDG